MVELDDRQIKFLQDYVERAKLNSSVLQEEFLDHLCCTVEAYLQNGCSFEEAAANALTAFGEDEMKKLESRNHFTHSPKQYYNEKSPDFP